MNEHGKFIHFKHKKSMKLNIALTVILFIVFENLNAQCSLLVTEKKDKFTDEKTWENKNLYSIKSGSGSIELAAQVGKYKK
jgi:hypothetical protein